MDDSLSADLSNFSENLCNQVLPRRIVAAQAAARREYCSVSEVVSSTNIVSAPRAVKLNGKRENASQTFMLCAVKARLPRTSVRPTTSTLRFFPESSLTL
jgi:hypothetical protein